MVPGYRRRSGCAVYDSADCSPERYRYPSPIRETHYPSRRNVPPYDARVNNVHEYCEPADADPRDNQPYRATPHQHSHHQIQAGQPVPQAQRQHPVQNRQQQFQPLPQIQNGHGQNAYHQHRTFPTYAEHTSTNQYYNNEEEETAPQERLLVKKNARAEQPLATGPKPASTDRFAAPHCPYDEAIQMDLKCANNYDWSAGKYVRDECGSGIVTKPCSSQDTRNHWCRTPLSIYQSSICELGRKLLCGEIRIPPRIMGPPPCNVCEEILPPCHGYYRPYEKLPPCEETFVKMSKGKKVYRDKVKRYWEPCDLQRAGPDEDIRTYSGQNAYLAMKLNFQPEEGNLDF